MFGLMSVDHICDVSLFEGPKADPDSPPNVFIELPHGATRLQHLQDTKSMVREYPGDDYDLFFLANTDQGSTEYAHYLASLLTSPDMWVDASFPLELAEPTSRLKVLVVRSLLPRTIIDVNRVWSDGVAAKEAGLTRGVPDFVTNEEDIKGLRQVFDRYHAVASKGYEVTMAGGGFAFNLHTYAPISVQEVDGENIVDTLRRAYTPEAYPTYPFRPVVQLITTPPGGEMLSNPMLRDHLINAYAQRGIDAICDKPFNLHPTTMACEYAKQYPGQTLTMEISRSHLVKVFSPFMEMEISPSKVAAMTRPIAEAFLRFLAK